MKRRPATRTPPRLSRSRSAARRDLSPDSGALYSDSGLKNGSQQLLATCHDRAVELLKRDLSPGGILAATATEKSAKRGYTSIFGRDAAICAIGMALSGDALLEREAVTGLHTLAAHQAPNGQIPKFVNDDGSARVGAVSPTSGKSRVRHTIAEADFWYLGCIDSTLWWLIAIAFLDERRKPRGLKRRYAKQIRLAIQWLLAQEHQRFFLLQQNEASDWADIMPRSGFVLYTNALWYHVKHLYRVPHIDRTRASFNGLFHPFSAGIAEYRRARLLNEYVLKKARYRDLFLSFVNFSFFGDEGDAFGNVLAILYGLMDDIAARRTVRALKKKPHQRSVPDSCHGAADSKKARCGDRTWRGIGRMQRGNTITVASGRWRAGSGWQLWRLTTKGAKRSVRSYSSRAFASWTTGASRNGCTVRRCPVTGCAGSRGTQPAICSPNMLYWVRDHSQSERSCSNGACGRNAALPSRDETASPLLAPVKRCPARAYGTPRARHVRAARLIATALCIAAHYCRCHLMPRT